MTHFTPDYLQLKINLLEKLLFKVIIILFVFNCDFMSNEKPYPLICVAGDYS